MMHKTGGIIGVSLMIETAIFAGNVAQAASATVSYTAPQKTNIRTGQGTSTALFGTVPGGTKITGVLQPSGWVKIATPAGDAGKYVLAAVLMSASTSAPGSVTAWAGYTTTYTYSASGSHGSLNRIPVNTQVTGTFVNNSWFRVNSGTFAGQYMQTTDLVFDQPGSAYGSTGPSWIASAGQTVTRYTISDEFDSAVRAAATTHSGLEYRLESGTKLVGQYVKDGMWFKITSGRYANYYIASDRVFAVDSEAYYNGIMPKVALFSLPSTFNDVWNPSTNRALQRDAASSLEEMNVAFKAKFGYNLTLDEGYRDITTQREYSSFLGYPRAAIPGTSNHGLGNAIDVEGETSAEIAGHASRYGYGEAAEQWLQKNALNYGWQRPAYMAANGSNPEYWHYNYVG